MGIIRSTFVIGQDGRLVSAQYKVSPKGHAAALLAQLAGEVGEQPAKKGPEAESAAKKSLAKKAPAKRTGARA